MIVVHQHPAGGRRRTADDIPRRDHEVVPRLQRRVLRDAAGGDDHHVGFQLQHVLFLRPGIVADGDAEMLQFGKPPVDDADHFLAPRAAGEQPDLTAGLRRRLQHGDLVAALGGDARGFQSRRAGADDHGAPGRPAGFLDDVRDGLFAAGGGVVNAQRLAALVEPVEAIGGADARPDAMLLAAHHLVGDMRVGHVGARHAHHIELAGGDGVPRGGHVGNLRRVKHRELRLGPHLAGEIQVRRGRHALDGNDLGQQRVGLDAAADQIDEIEPAGRGDAPGDLHPLLFRQAVGAILVGHHADTDDEVGTDGGPDGVDDPPREPQTVVERPAVIVGPAVGRGRPEPVHQVAVGLDLDAVETGAACARRRR